jgi:predicted nucleic acid-binding protein
VSAVVSDTSPLHYLVLCESVNVLRSLFGEVLIPPMVFQELHHQQTPPRVRAWAQFLPAWRKVQKPSVLDHTLNVDEGEREAISLACEIHAVVILMDDRKGRSEALRCGLQVTGTIGLLEAAAARGLVDLAKVFQLLRQTTARLDEELMQAALQRHRARQIQRGPEHKP